MAINRKAVEVIAGKVTLDGSVYDRSMRHAIENLVDAVPGVKDIDNRVRVSRNEGAGWNSGTDASSYDDTSTSIGNQGSAGSRSR